MSFTPSKKTHTQATVAAKTCFPCNVLGLRSSKPHPIKQELLCEKSKTETAQSQLKQTGGLGTQKNICTLFFLFGKTRTTYTHIVQTIYIYIRRFPTTSGLLMEKTRKKTPQTNATYLCRKKQNAVQKIHLSPARFANCFPPTIFSHSAAEGVPQMRRSE